MNSSLSLDSSQQSQQQIPYQADHCSSLKKMIKEYIVMSEDRKSHTEDLVQSQAESIKNVEIQIGQLACEIKKQAHDTLPSDTENLEDVEKEHFEIMLIVRDEVLEIAQTNSGNEGYVDDFSDVSIVDVQVFDKI